MEGGISCQEENLEGSDWYEEPLLVATTSVMTECIDCGHVCVQPGDAGSPSDQLTPPFEPPTVQPFWTHSGDGPTICGETTRDKNLCFVHFWSFSLLTAGVRDTVQHA